MAADWGDDGEGDVSKKKNQTVTTGLDPSSQAYVDQMRQYAMGAAMGGPMGAYGGGGGYGAAGSNPLRGAVLGGGGGLGGLGNFGFGAALGQNGLLGQLPANNSYFTGPQTMSIGDQVKPFMNPYMQHVVDATRGEFDHLRGQAAMGSDQQATMAGAFGGSRHGVATGVRLGELDRAQGAQIAGLLHGGYQNALQTGLGYAEHQRQLRQQQLQEPMFRLGMMNLGMGPTGSVSSQPMQRSAAGGIAGGALTGAQLGSMIPGIGTAAGAIGGGLLGWLGI